MGGTRLQTLHRHTGPLFVGVVTIALVAFVYGQAGRGYAGLPGMLVYGLAAGFGLEFLGSAWAGRWRERSARRALRG